MTLIGLSQLEINQKYSTFRVFRTFESQMLIKKLAKSFTVFFISHNQFLSSLVGLV